MTTPTDDMRDVYGDHIPEDLEVTRRMYASIATHRGVTAQAGIQRAMLVAIASLEAAIVARDANVETRRKGQ